MTGPNAEGGSELEFPVVWDEPADAERAWRFERWHNPRPITPLSFDYYRIVFAGFARAHAATGRPIRMDARRVNCYVYLGMREPTASDPGADAADPQPGRWENHAWWWRHWLPEIQSYLAAWERFHGQSGPEPGNLLEHLDQSLRWIERAWEIHDRIEVSVATLIELCQQQIGWDAARAQGLLTGGENLSLESDATLRRLADIARNDSGLVTLLNITNVDGLEDALTKVDAPAFRTELLGFLDRFGRKSDSWSELMLPSWREDPSPVLVLVKQYLSEAGDERSQRRIAARTRRKAAEAEASELFRARDSEGRADFERELEFCRAANRLGEDHNYWIDQQVMYWARMDMLVAGRLLTASGAIADVDDVFFLTLDEVKAGLRGGSEDRKDSVHVRRAELEHFASIEPPSELGIPASADVNEALNALFGEVAAGGDAEIITGQAGSIGVITATARILKSVAEAERLNAGEILVVETTSPPWTALFGIAGGLVTDGGGALSHAAVVAREYGIPAVVGTVSATRRVRDGQTVRVDGGAGTVELLGD